MDHENQVSSTSFGESYEKATDKGEETICDSGLGDDDLSSCTTLKTLRAQLILEFIQTETNYVSILDTIIQIRNEATDTKNNEIPLLNMTEVKSIFPGIEAIQKLHHSLLNDLEEEFHNADLETFPIGKILLKHASEMFKVYPPFVNFFERAQAALQSCDSQNSRFHDYLALWQSKPECGRQSLSDLMIRPIQRLGSISLLVKSILKQTDNSNIDYPYLKKALTQILEAVSNIDKDKERAHKMFNMFDIFNSIEDCPPNLVSSSRNLLFELQAVDVNGFDKFGHHFQIFVFSDLIEVSKIKGYKYYPSPMANILGMATSEQRLKHYMTVTFSSIHRIIDFIDCKCTKDTFGLVATDELDGEEKVMCFSILPTEGTKKDECLTQLCKAIAVCRCIKDPMSILSEVNCDDLYPNAVDRSGYSMPVKALNILRTPINLALNLCTSQVKITKDMLSFLFVEDSLRSNAKSSSCSELVKPKKQAGNEVVRSMSLPAKTVNKS